MSTDNKMPSQVLEENELNTPKIHTQTHPLPVETPPLPKHPVIPPSLPARQASPALPSRPSIPPRPIVQQQQQQNDDEEITHSIKPRPAPSSGGYINNQSSFVSRKFSFAQNDICTGCGKAVYAAELVLGAGNKYHKLCLKCCQCAKRLDSSNMVDRDFDLYCRGCYSKLFGPKGYGYNNLLSTDGATR